MAIFRNGIKVGNKDIRTGLSKERAQGILRKTGIIKDGKGRKALEKDGNSIDHIFYIYDATAAAHRLDIDASGNIIFGTANAKISGSSTSTGSFGRVNAITGFFEAGSKISDYVFEDDYNWGSLGEVEAHISQSKHLPGIPSEANIQEWRDLSMGDRDRLLLEKIEELTLYVISLHKEVEELKGNS